MTRRTTPRHEWRKKRLQERHRGQSRKSRRPALGADFLDCHANMIELLPRPIANRRKVCGLTTRCRMTSCPTFLGDGPAAHCSQSDESQTEKRQGGWFGRSYYRKYGNLGGTAAVLTGSSRITVALLRVRTEDGTAVNRLGTKITQIRRANDAGASIVESQVGHGTAISSVRGLAGRR